MNRNRLLLVVLSMAIVCCMRVFANTEEITSQELQRLQEFENKGTPISLYNYDPKDDSKFKLLSMHLKYGNNVEFRQTAAEVLRNKGDRRVIPVLKEALKDKDPIVRSISAQGLVRLGEKNVGYAELEKLIEIGCVSALDDMTVWGQNNKRVPRDPIVIKLLRKALQSPNEDISIYAAQGLVAIGERGDDVYARMSEVINSSSNFEMQKRAINLLKEVGDDKSIDILKKAKHNTSQKLRREIDMALLTIEARQIK